VRRRGSLLVLAGSLLAAACSSSDSGSIQIITGGETDTFTRSPVPAELLIQSIDSSGNTTTLASAKLPTSTIDLGSRTESTIASIEVTGLAADGKTPLIFGTSVPLFFGGLNGATVPVFVQRVGEFARLPGLFGDARQTPLLAVVQGEYLFATGGGPSSLATTMDLYDFGGFSPVTSSPTLPLAPQSLAFVGTYGWFFASDGTAHFYDLGGGGDLGAIPPLPGGSFADIAGGATVVGDSGVQYIVGATRTTGAPTAAVLAIDPNDSSNSSYPYGGPKWITLAAQRLGAAATWVSGRGLVVIGGSPMAAGVEIVSSGTTTGAPLGYPADPSMSAGATPLSTETVVVAGGLTPTGTDPGVRTIDLACAAACMPATWGTPLAVPLDFAQAFTISASKAFVVGNDALIGLTHAFTVTATATTEIPTKVPHSNARAIWSPVGSIAVVGGSGQIETFAFSP
jgi:hypothetical protein